jgi:hypothetical protein
MGKTLSWPANSSRSRNIITLESASFDMDVTGLLTFQPPKSIPRRLTDSFQHSAPFLSSVIAAAMVEPTSRPAPSSAHRRDSRIKLCNPRSDGCLPCRSQDKSRPADPDWRP